MGWSWLVQPLGKLLDQPARQNFLKENLAWFNANPYICTYAAGAVAKFLEQKKDLGQISRLKQAIRGPLGSLGDNLIWQNARPAFLCLGLIVSLGLDCWGPAVFFLTFNSLHLYLRTRGIIRGYQLGEEVFRDFSGRFWRKGIPYFGLLGAFLAGFLLVLAASRQLQLKLDATLIFLIIFAAALAGFKRRVSVPVLFSGCLGLGIILKLALGLL